MKEIGPDEFVARVEALEDEMAPRPRGLRALVGAVFADKSRAPAVFFVLTLCTVFWVGIDQGQEFYKGLGEKLGMSDPRVLWQALVYTVALMAILCTHELGHWLVARAHRVKTSLPIFIPIPVGMGTFGAVISMDELPPDRKTLLRIGAAGPIAGGVVALIVMALALPGCPDVSAHAADLLTDGPTATFNLGSSLGMQLLEHVLHTHVVSSDHILATPLFFAAWTGFLLTSINLFPIGQLDGGHVAYAIVGPRMNGLSRWIAIGVMALSIPGFLAGGIAPTYLFWGLLTFFAVSWHPPVPHPEETLPLDAWIVAGVAVLFFVLTFMLVPMSVVLD